MKLQKEVDPAKAVIIDFELRTSRGIKHLASCKVTSSQLILIGMLDGYKIWSSKYLIAPRHFDNYTDLT